MGLFLLLIFVILKLPIPVKIKLYANLEDMKMYYCVKLLGIKLLCGKIEIFEDNFCIQNTHDIFSKIDVKDKQKEGLFIQEVVRRIEVSKLNIYVSIGIKDDACAAHLLSSSLFAVLVAASEILLSKYDSIHISENIQTCFDKTQLEICTESSMQLSIDEIITAKMVANKKHKENMYGK